VSAQSIAESWSRAVKWLAPALDNGWTEDEVLNELILGRAQLWEGDEGAVVTCCFPPDQFHVWLAGGSLSGVLTLLGGGIAWARPMGLRRMTLKGRPGWKRALQPLGFTDQGDGVLERVIV
jgi:hypothetical protein